MKITIWDGCLVVKEINLRLEGPDVHIDPINRCGNVTGDKVNFLFEWEGSR